MEYNNPDAGKGLGIAALVVGIIGFLISCLPVVGLFLGLLGLGLSISGLVQANKHSAKKGLLISALVISIIVSLIGLAWTGFIINKSDGVNDLFDEINNETFYDINDELNNIDENFDSLSLDPEEINNLEKSNSEPDNGVGPAPD